MGARELVLIMYTMSAMFWRIWGCKQLRLEQVTSGRVLGTLFRTVRDVCWRRL